MAAVLLALFSDVHSNVHALEAVLDAVEDASPDALCFLGDAVGYNAFPQESVNLLDKHCDLGVVGNHDQAVLEGGEEWFNPAAQAGVEYSRRKLDKAGLEYLRSLPTQTQYGPVHLVHGSPRAPTTEYVFPETHPEALEEIVRQPSVGRASIVAMGHTHQPFVRALGDDLLVTNVGSVGQPRDGDPRACWALVDTEEPSVEIVRTPYDIESAAKAIVKAGLPRVLAERLYEGW